MKKSITSYSSDHRNNWVLRTSSLFSVCSSISKAASYPIGCESLFRNEVKNILAALAEQLSEPDNVMPTLNELIALDLYSLPQDRKFKGNYPEGTHDLRVKLITNDDRHNKEDWKIIVTSIGNRCVKGKILVINGRDDYKGEWVEEYSEE